MVWNVAFRWKLKRRVGREGNIIIIGRIYVPAPILSALYVLINLPHTIILRGSTICSQLQMRKLKVRWCQDLNLGNLASELLPLCQTVSRSLFYPAGIRPGCFKAFPFCKSSGTPRSVHKQRHSIVSENMKLTCWVTFKYAHLVQKANLP